MSEQPQFVPGSRTVAVRSSNARLHTHTVAFQHRGKGTARFAVRFAEEPDLPVRGLPGLWAKPPRFVGPGWTLLYPKISNTKNLETIGEDFSPTAQAKSIPLVSQALYSAPLSPCSFPPFIPFIHYVRRGTPPGFSYGTHRRSSIQRHR